MTNGKVRVLRCGPPGGLAAVCNGIHHLIITAEKHGRNSPPNTFCCTRVLGVASLDGGTIKEVEGTAIRARAEAATTTRPFNMAVSPASQHGKAGQACVAEQMLAGRLRTLPSTRADSWPVVSDPAQLCLLTYTTPQQGPTFGLIWMTWSQRGSSLPVRPLAPIYTLATRPSIEDTGPVPWDVEEVPTSPRKCRRASEPRAAARQLAF